MLSRVRSRIPVLALALFAAAGCASSTNGSGAASPASSVASTPDFPTQAPSTAPATSAPASTGAESSGAPASSGGASKIHPAPANPLRTVTVNAGDGTTYVVKIWADVQNDTCFDHAYGNPVITFLTKHPCLGLRRYLGTTTVNGRPVAFAMSSTGFQGTASDPYKWAGAFSQLEQQDGTGSIADLLREGYRLPQGPTAVPSSEAFNVLGQDNGVTIWDAWYLDGSTPPNAKALIKMTQDLFLQF
jgi:hypothetical protein